MYTFITVIVCTAILHIAMCICIPTYMTKFLDIYIQNCVSYMLCNIILLCTVCSQIYRHTCYIYMHTHTHKHYIYIYIRLIEDDISTFHTLTLFSNSQKLFLTKSGPLLNTQNDNHLLRINEIFKLNYEVAIYIYFKNTAQSFEHPAPIIL